MLRFSRFGVFRVPIVGILWQCFWKFFLLALAPGLEIRRGVLHADPVGRWNTLAIAKLIDSKQKLNCLMVNVRMGLICISIWKSLKIGE